MDNAQDDIDKKITELEDKVGNPEFKINAMDPQTNGPFVEAFDQFSCASARAWLMLETGLPEFRNMQESDRISALVNGTLAGVIALVMSKLQDEHADMAVEYVKNCIEASAFNAARLVQEWKKSMSQLAREQEGHQPGTPLH